MTLKEIVTVSGQSGLFKSVATSRNAIIVENIETGQRMTVPSTARASSLKDIAVFTKTDEKSLAQILKSIRENLQENDIISHKAEEKKLKEFFSTVVPDYDDAKVYLSDIKKIVKWYHILKTHNLLDLIDVEEKTEAEENQENNENLTEEDSKNSETTKDDL